MPESTRCARPLALRRSIGQTNQTTSTLNNMNEPKLDDFTRGYTAAADAAAGRASERKWQADMIRKIVKCPFTN